MAYAPASMPRSVPARPAGMFPKPIGVDAGPWATLDDSLDITHAGPGIARQIVNAIPIDGGAIVGRPGAVKVGAAAPGVIQSQGQLTAADGTEYTYRLTNGVIQTLNWSNSTWTTVVSAANFVTAGITISTTAPFWVITFNGKLLAHDGTNRPWTWTGASGAGGLAAAGAVGSVWYGRPAVKDSRVFAILNATRTTFEFTAINDPTTITSNWAFGQADETPLTALIGLNDALIVFRARSCQAVLGKTTATWSTDATRAGLSQTIGTSSPGTVTERNGEVWFIDSDGRPQVMSAQQGPSGTLISVGPDAAPMWHRLRENLRTTSTTAANLVKQHGLVYPQLDLVLLSNTTSSATTNPDRFFVMDPTRKEPIATWNGFEMLTVGVVKNGSNQPLMMFSGAKNNVAADGYSYYFAFDLNLGPWDDAWNAGTTAVTHTVEPTSIATDTSVEVNWDQLHTTSRTFTDLHIAVSVKTTQTTRAGQTIAVGGGVFILGTSLLGTGVLGSDPTERKWTVGLGSQGRGLVPVYTHQTLSENFGLVKCRAEGTAVTDHPRVR